MATDRFRRATANAEQFLSHGACSQHGDDKFWSHSCSSAIKMTRCASHGASLFTVDPALNRGDGVANNSPIAFEWRPAPRHSPSAKGCRGDVQDVADLVASKQGGNSWCCASFVKRFFDIRCRYLIKHYTYQLSSFIRAVSHESIANISLNKIHNSKCRSPSTCSMS